MMAAMDGVLLCDKPAGKTSHDMVAVARRAVRAETGERAASAMPARSTRSPPAC